jgi:integrase
MLTNATLKAARPGARPRKIFDEGGLYVHILPSGRKTWRMKYRFDRKEKLLTFGTYPDVQLAGARDRRDQARALLDRGEDPSAARPSSIDIAAPSTPSTFEAAARAWFEHQRARWTDVHARDVLVGLERDVFPAIGPAELDAIARPTVLRVLRAVEARGSVETARRLRQRISAVFEYAMSEGWAAEDPAAIVGRALAAPPASRPQPALVDLDEVRALLAAVECINASPRCKLASRFLALTGVRLAAVRGATWAEIEGVEKGAEDLAHTFSIDALWRVPAARMKMARAKKADPTRAHLVPLSRQAVDVLRAARLMAGENGHDTRSPAALIFPGRGGVGPLGEAAIGELYTRAGYAGRHVPHGWRASFSTIMNERRPDDRAAIDLALAHAPKDKVEAAYNRAEHLARRRALFQEWADLLDAA